MGKAEIIAEIGDGKYTIKILRDFTRLDDKIASLQAQVTVLQSQIAAEPDGQSKDVLLLRQTSINKHVARLQSVRTDPQIDTWCIDYTTGLTGQVGTIEIPGERGVVLIQAGGSYSAATDGQLQISESGTPSSVFFNWALLPGWQKWKPTYRAGNITSIDHANNEITVTLDAAYSPAQSKSVNQTSILNDVPADYGDCDDAIFEEGDEIVVKFENQDWSQPKVVGFQSNPRPCDVQSILRPSTTGYYIYGPDGQTSFTAFPQYTTQHTTPAGLATVSGSTHYLGIPLTNDLSFLPTKYGVVNLASSKWGLPAGLNVIALYFSSGIRDNADPEDEGYSTRDSYYAVKYRLGAMINDSFTWLSNEYSYVVQRLQNGEYILSNILRPTRHMVIDPINNFVHVGVFGYDSFLANYNHGSQERTNSGILTFNGDSLISAEVGGVAGLEHPWTLGYPVNQTIFKSWGGSSFSLFTGAIVESSDIPDAPFTVHNSSRYSDSQTWDSFGAFHTPTVWGCYVQKYSDGFQKWDIKALIDDTWVHKEDWRDDSGIGTVYSGSFDPWGGAFPNKTLNRIHTLNRQDIFDGKTYNLPILESDEFFEQTVSSPDVRVWSNYGVTWDAILFEEV